MLQPLTTFGASANSGLLSALGIDWRLLILQIIAFLLFVWALKKWVYPIFTEAIDKRERQLEAGAQAAKDAQKNLDETRKKMDEALRAAREEADEIIAAAHKESGLLVAEAEDKARRRAESIVEEAKGQIDVQIQSARRALKKDALSLIARATEKVIGEKIDPTKDASLVDRAIKSAENEA